MKKEIKESDANDANVRSACGAGGRGCGAVRTGNLGDRRIEFSESRCNTVNDAGLLVHQNGATGVPYILGPDQKAFFDWVYYTLPVLPEDRNRQLALSMKDLFVRIRKPNTTTAPYTVEEMMCWFLNARSRRIKMNVILRILSYMDGRLEGSLNWARMLAAALGGPLDIRSPNLAQEFHDYPSSNPEEYKDLVTLASIVAKLVAENDYQFGSKMIADDDYMYRDVYADDCESAELIAFFPLGVPHFSVDGSKVKMDSYAELFTLSTYQTGADLADALVDMLEGLRGEILAERTVARSALMIDLQDYIEASKMPLGPVCLARVEQIIGDEYHAPIVKEIPRLSDEWGMRIVNAVPLHCRCEYESGGNHTCNSYLATTEIDMSDGVVKNVINENLPVTASHSYAQFDEVGYTIVSEESCPRGDKVRSLSYFIVPATYKDSAIGNDLTIGLREVTLQECRGTVMVDHRYTWTTNNANNVVGYGSTAAKGLQSNASNNIWDLLAPMSKVKYYPEVVKLGNPAKVRFQQKRHISWITRRLVRTHQAAAGLELWLSVSMLPFANCKGGSAAEISEKLE